MGNQAKENRPTQHINKSFSSVETQREIRIERMRQYEALGYNPFPADSRRDYTLYEVKNQFEERKGTGGVFLAGRIKSKRLSGKIGFVTLEDESLPEGFQLIFKKDELEGQTLDFEQFKLLFDEGDYIEACGTLDVSQRGEPSLFVQSYRMLTKALRPLPDEMTDIEDIYRHRYIDMRLHPEVRELFRRKSLFWTASREFMINHGFIEIIMPTMEHTTGGAEATPFETHHNALDEDFYLRISSELHQKRMIVGGFEKIFDIDKNFRNEGIDDEHLQEFTQLEFYWAYADYSMMIDYSEELIKYVIKKTFGSLILQYDSETKVDWSKPWPRIPYYEFVEKYAGIKLSNYNSIEKLQELASSLGLEFSEKDGYGRLVDLIYKKTARPKCVEPVWLIDQPVEISPLAKRISEKPELTQRLQLIAYGSELCNGYSELNDPVDQLQRFEEQQLLREKGDSEAMMIDHDFVNALEIGMPPTAGFAYSERLFSILERRPIRECAPFPLLRRDKDASGKAKRTMVVHCVLLNTPEIEPWQKLNAAAHLAARLGVDEGKSLLHADSSDTKDGEKIPMNMQHAIVIKQATEKSQLHALKLEAEKAGVTVTCFTKEMMSSSDDNHVILEQSKKDAKDIGWLGVLVFGRKGEVEKLTNGFELFS